MCRESQRVLFALREGIWNSKFGVPRVVIMPKTSANSFRCRVVVSSAGDVLLLNTVSVQTDRVRCQLLQQLATTILYT